LLRLGPLALRFDTNRAVWVGRVVDLTDGIQDLTLLAEKAGRTLATVRSMIWSTVGFIPGTARKDIAPMSAPSSAYPRSSAMSTPFRYIENYAGRIPLDAKLRRAAVSLGRG
jgi:hypothetical protein